MIPVLTTERLILRGPEVGDYPDYAEFWKSDRSAHILGPLPDWGIWLQFSAMAGHWSLRGFGWWTILDRASDRIVGWMGLFHPAHYPDPELGWILTSWAEGQGFATEAAVAIRGHGQQTLGMNRIISFIDDANTRSKNLADRLGAERILSDSFMGKAYHVYLHRNPGVRP